MRWTYLHLLHLTLPRDCLLVRVQGECYYKSCRYISQGQHHPAYLFVLSHPVGGAGEGLLGVVAEKRGGKFAEVNVAVAEVTPRVRGCVYGCVLVYMNVRVDSNVWLSSSLNRSVLALSDARIPKERRPACEVHANGK